MRLPCILLALLLLSLCCVPVFSQPLAYYECTPACFEAAPVLFDGGDCDLLLTYEAGEGRTLWGPLQNTGPVQIGLVARRPYAPIEPLPLLVRVLDAGSPDCHGATGTLVWQTLGTDPDECVSIWLWSPPIDLSASGIAVGTSYWVQLESAYQPGPNPPSLEGAASSALRACVAVTAASTVSAEPTNWSAIKLLFGN